MNVATAEDHVLEIERRLNAEPDRVFAAWIEPDQMAEWFGPGNMTIPHSSADARVGGAWSVTMRNEGGHERIVGGVYREIDRPKRLVFTWGWLVDGQPGKETEVAVDFIADGDGTLMRLTQRGFDTAENRDMHNKGWSYSFDGLARLVEA